MIAAAKATGPAGSAGPLDDVLTLPVVLVALLRAHSFNVTLYRNRMRGDLWWFRFHHRSVLQMGDDGAWRWHRRLGPQCDRVEALIEEAEVRLARACR